MTCSLNTLHILLKKKHFQKSIIICNCLVLSRNCNWHFTDKYLEKNSLKKYIVMYLTTILYEQDMMQV